MEEYVDVVFHTELQCSDNNVPLIYRCPSCGRVLARGQYYLMVEVVAAQGETSLGRYLLGAVEEHNCKCGHNVRCPLILQSVEEGEREYEAWQGASNDLHSSDRLINLEEERPPTSRRRGLLQ